MYTMQVEGEPDFLNPSTDDVVAAMGRLRPFSVPSFCSLNSPSESYAQMTGAKLRLTVEYRSVEGDSFRHFVLGHVGEEGETQIKCRVGSIRVLKREVLTLSDAVEIFQHFLKNEGIPSQYLKRETREMFLTE